MLSVSPPPLVRMVDISKKFGSVPVLQNVRFDIFPGEVHLLAGENGAGKSTLINILGGILTDYEGTVEIQGRPVRLTGPAQAEQHGIAVIHQELSLVPGMSVAENMFLNRFPGHFGFLDKKALRANAERLTNEFGLSIDVDRPLEEYPLSVQQMIEIAKALSQKANVIVMDEPTSALNAPEVERLFDLIDRLKRQGCGIVYITHKMEEIQRISDRITVLRDGKWIGSEPAQAFSSEKLISMMVGRELEQNDSLSDPDSGTTVFSAEPLLQLENVSVQTEGQSACRGVDLEVRPGEIVGLAGLQGSGASPLLEALFGAYGSGAIAGNVRFRGKPLRVRDPGRSLREGIALLPNDRKGKGLVLSMSIVENMNMAIREKGGKRFLSAFFASLGFVPFARQRKRTGDLGASMNLKAASLEMDVGRLSGGNQQKVALGKWALTEPKLLMLDEPTRGVDIAAKREIYSLIERWKKQGIGILLITSEMPELLALSDRIVVLHRGTVAARFDRREADSEKILAAAMGETQETVA